MTADVTITVNGKEDVHRMLEPWMEPRVRSRLQAALREGAKQIIPELRSQASPVSKRMTKRVSSLKYPAKKIRGHTDIPRPTYGDPAQVVGFRIKGAFFSHFLIRGTKGHETRGHRVRGIPGNDIVSRAKATTEGRTMAAIVDYLDRTEAR